MAMAALPLFCFRVLSDYDVTPWRSGLGTSSEVAVMPPGINHRLEDFVYRVSIAEMTASRSFSVFHSYNRIMYVS